MKEIVSVNANLFLMESKDGKAQGMAEVILLVSEPKYEAGLEGLIKRRTVEEFRFTAMASTLRQVIDHLTSIAKETEALESRTTIAPELEA